MRNSKTLIQAADPLPTKVTDLQHFLGERFFDETGLMYAMWRFKDDQLRPFVAADFEGGAVFKIRAGTSMQDLMNHENSPYTSGAFLWSQVVRQQVEPSAEALRYAAKAFRSLEINFQMSADNGQRGLLCKPYGEKFSPETSPDQYVPVMLGLWEYNKIADEATKKKIQAMIPAMADWWRTRDYKLVYFDQSGDWLYHDDARAQYGPLYVVMHLMAHRITNDPVYRKEADRLLELIQPFACRHDYSRKKLVKTGETFWPEKLHGYEYDPARRPYIQLDWENQHAIWLAAVSAAWLLENEPGLQNTLSHAMGNYYRHTRSTLDADLMSLYWTQTDLETGMTYPVVRPRISTNRKDYIIDFDWNFCAYTSKVCCGDAAARIADCALMAHQFAPGFSPGALSLAKTMFAKLDDQRLHHFIDPDSKQLMPEDNWCGHTLSSEVPAFTCLSYWRARQWGIDLGSAAQNHQ